MMKSAPKKIFMGEAGGVAGECSQTVKEAFNNMRFIVTVDWSIYKSGLKVDHLSLHLEEAILSVNNPKDVVVRWSCWTRRTSMYARMWFR